MTGVYAKRAGPINVHAIAAIEQPTRGFDISARVIDAWTVRDTTFHNGRA